MFDFTGKTVFITGGASGIGREIAIAFLSAGASVIIASLPTSQPALDHVRTERLDISDASAVAKLIATVPELHILISAAGMMIAQLTRSLGVARAPDGIRMNAVAPGWIATTLTQALRDDEARSAPIMTRSPFRRWGRPEEIAGPVLFLCSDAASFVTGAIIPVDGGYSTA